jgi:negative regulator of sigma E activity
VSPITDEELDRLADYAAGLLEPDLAARVARLIETEPEWARAHTALAATAGQVTGALAGLAVLSIPPDVADRLDAAIAAEASTASGGTEADALPARTNVVELAARRGWRRLAVGTAAAAAVVVAGIGGVTVLTKVLSQNRSSTSAGQGTTGSAARPNGPDLYGAPLPTRENTGADYTPQTLRSLLTASARAPMKAGRSGEGEPAELNRLTDPGALNACLNAIVARHGGRPTVVDYARYQGQPALIVALSGTRIVVSGPDCGLPGMGAAEIYSVTE